jgi:hypothetical protein
MTGEEEAAACFSAPALSVLLLLGVEDDDDLSRPMAYTGGNPGTT